MKSAIAAALAAILSISPAASPDASRPAGNRIVMGRSAGWEVEEVRDLQGNAIRKTWIDPDDRKNTYVRLYTYDLATGKLVEERDIHGRQKRIIRGADGKAFDVIVPLDFIEESRQHEFMVKRIAAAEDRP